MRKTDFDGISNEDLERFEELLRDFYGLPWEESYLRLTKEIEERILRKDTNPRYRSHFEIYLDDLVISVVCRFVRINSKLQAEGQKIHNFHAMLENRIGHVYHEELRKIFKAAKFIDIDDVNALPDTSSPFDELEQKERYELIVRCHQKCFEDLPAHIADIFVEYYGTDGLSPSQRTHKRQQLAARLAGLLPSEATLEEMKKAKDNLQSLIWKWRKKHLTPCKNKCMESRSSYH